MKLKDISKIERPREKLEKYGPGKLSEAELLAILLGTGTKGIHVLDLARKILRKISGEIMKDVSVEELKEIHGLGSAKACEIVAALELGKRLLQGKRAALLLSPQDVWNELKDIRNHKKEHFIVFFLDSKNQEVKRDIVSVGTLNANLVHPREVFEPAVKHLASHILIAHNHPSGNCDPSEEDIELTKRLADAGKILGIEIIDHVIVSPSGFLSFKEKRLI